MRSHLPRSKRSLVAIGVSAIAAVLVAGTAFAGESVTQKVDKGYWGGPYGSVWTPGPYEKSYEVNPPLSEATKQRMAEGHWSGPYGSNWTEAPYDKPYKVNPQITAETKAKMARGHWTGPYGSVWVPASKSE